MRILYNVARTVLSIPRHYVRPATSLRQISFPRQFCDVKPLGGIEKVKHKYLEYTCKVCQTINKQTISVQAFTKGVVISQCSGCKNNHLIADNLGFFRDNKINIIDILKEKGETVKTD